MKKLLPLFWAVILILSGCYSEGVNYSRSLFKHIPEDPELLVLVKPNDITSLAEVAIAELNLQQFFSDRLNMDLPALDGYKDVFVEVMEKVGIPYDKVESAGVLIYFQKPVLLISGDFKKEAISQKMGEIGFKQLSNGYFEYLVHPYLLSIPDDGVIMLAEAELLDDLSVVPEENRLWNRDDFREYRETSPLDNSVFIWSHPPERFLSDFAYQEDLGDVSLALNFRSNFSLKATVHIKDPQKAVYLHDMILGTMTFASGFFGEDPDYGPLFKGIKVTQDNRKVEASLVLSNERLLALKKRVVDDINNPDSKTFNKLQSVMDSFK